MKYLTFIMVLCSTSALAHSEKNKDNEESKAISACFSAMKVLESKDEKQARNKPSKMCNINTRKKEYWLCVEKRLKKDESFIFSTSQCESLDPQSR